MNDIYYLSHGGPGSGRYPWGSGDRPYQRLEKPKSKKSGITEYIKSIKAKNQKKQEINKQIEEKKRNAQKEKIQKELEDNKERVLREGSASEVLKYQGKISNQELRNVLNRLEMEETLKKYSSKEIQSGLDKLKKIQSYTNVGSSLAKDGISLYNSFVSIYNTTSNGKQNPLTKINTGDGGNVKKKK